MIEIVFDVRYPPPRSNFRDVGRVESCGIINKIELCSPFDRTLKFEIDRRWKKIKLENLKFKYHSRKLDFEMWFCVREIFYISFEDTARILNRLIKHKWIIMWDETKLWKKVDILKAPFTAKDFQKFKIEGDIPR